ARHGPAPQVRSPAASCAHAPHTRFRREPIMTTLKPIAAAALLAATAVACKESPAEVRTPVAAAQAAGAAQDTMQRRGRPFHRGMLRLPPQLELTAEQKAQLEQIRTELM